MIQYNKRDIQELLKGFDVQALRTFCLTTPKFEDVYHKLATETGKDVIIEKIIAHADNTFVFPKLLEWAKEKNPRRYEVHIGADDEPSSTFIPERAQLDHLPSPATLYGREDELTRCAVSLRQRGGLLLSGAAGSGKTALGAKLARQLAPEAHIFYLKFGPATQEADDLIWQLAHFLKEALEDETALNFLRDERLSQRQNPGNYQVAPPSEKLKIILKGLQKRRSVVYLDDYHHIVDNQSLLEAISMLAKTMPSESRETGYYLLLAGRGELPAIDLPTEVVPDLDSDAVGELLAQQTPNWSGEWTAELWRKFGGNPLRLAYVAAHFSPLSADEIPAVLNKLERWQDADLFLQNELWPSLPDNAQQILDVISLFRGDAPYGALQTVFNETNIDGGLRTLLNGLTRQRLLIKSEAETTPHYTLHDVMKKFRRQERDLGAAQTEHQIIAQFFGQRANYIETSYHFFQAANYDRALDILKARKEKLLFAGQSPAALEMLDEARKNAYIGEGVSNDWRMKELELRGEWLQLSGKYPEAEDNFKKILELSDFPPETLSARIRRRRGENALYQGNLDDAKAHLLRAVKLFEESQNTDDFNPLEEGIARYWLGRIYFLQGSDFDAAENHSSRALELFNQINALRWQLRAENTLATLRFVKGDLPAGIQKLEAIIAKVEDAGLTLSPEAAIVYDNLGTAYYLQQKYKDSIKYYQESLDIADKIGWLYQSAKTRSSVNLVYIQLGRWKEAIENSQKALEAYTITGDKMGEFYARNGLGIIAHRSGKLTEAQKVFLKCYNLAKEQNYQVEQIIAMNNLGLLYNDMVREGLEYLDRAQQLSQEIENDEFDIETFTAQAHIKTKLGQLDSALEDAQKALNLAEDWEDNYLIGQSKIALGAVYIELGRYDEAEDALQNAIEVLEKDLYEKGKAVLYLGRLFARSGQEAQARIKLQEAIEIFESIKVSWLKERAQAEIQHLNKQ